MFTVVCVYSLTDFMLTCACLLRLWTAAAKLSGSSEPLCIRSRPHPGHGTHVALQPHHAHAERAAPHTALISGGHRGPDGVVPRELA